MTERDIQVPGGSYFNDVAEASLAQRQIPGWQFINETEQSEPVTPTMLAGFGRRKMVRIFRGAA